MSITTTHWVFWISLLLLLPLPVVGAVWAWLPVGYLLLLFSRGEGLTFLLYALFWGTVLWGASRAYCYWSRQWESQIRGSLMAIMVLSLLVLFSSVPVYQPAGQGSRLTFQWLYE